MTHVIRAFIADNVGDNVGDVAGMGSDIFESYCGSMIASIAIASTLGMTMLSSLAPDMAEGEARSALMFMPLALASTGFDLFSTRYRVSKGNVRTRTGDRSAQRAHSRRLSCLSPPPTC